MTSDKSAHESKLLDLEWSKKGYGSMGYGLGDDLEHEPYFCYESEFNNDVAYIDTRTSRRARLREHVSELRHVSECERIKAKKGHGLNGCSYCLVESGYISCGFDELCDFMCFACFKRSHAKNCGAAISSAVGILSATQFKDAWYRKLIVDTECASCHIYSPALDARLKNTSGKPIESLDATYVDACADYYLWADKKKHSSSLPIPVPKGFDIIVWCGCCQAIVLRTKTYGMHQIVESKRCMHKNKSVLIRCEIIDSSLLLSATKGKYYDYESELRSVAKYNFLELCEACLGEPRRNVNAQLGLEECNSEDQQEHLEGILHDEGTSSSSCIYRSAPEDKVKCAVSVEPDPSVSSSNNAFWSKMRLDGNGAKACEALSYVARAWCSDVPDEVSNIVVRSLVAELSAGALSVLPSYDESVFVSPQVSGDGTAKDDMAVYDATNSGVASRQSLEKNCNGACPPKCITRGNMGYCKSNSVKEPKEYRCDSHDGATTTRGGVDDHPRIPGSMESASAWVPKMMSVRELAACKVITVTARTVNLYNLWRRYASSIGSVDELRKIFGQDNDAIVIRCMTRLATLMSMGPNVSEDGKIVGLHGFVVSVGLCSCGMMESPMMHGKSVECVGSTCINFTCMDTKCLTGTSRCIIVARIVCEYALWPSALHAIQVAIDGLSTGVSKGLAKSWQLESTSGRTYIQMGVVTGVADSFCAAGPRCFLHRISQLWASKHSGTWTVPPALNQICCVSSYIRVAFSTTVRKAGHLMDTSSQEAALALASCIAPTTPERLMQAAYVQCFGQPPQATDSWLDGVKAWSYYTKRGMIDGLLEVEWEGRLLLCAATGLMTTVEVSGALSNGTKIMTEPTDIISVLTAWEKLLRCVL